MCADPVHLLCPPSVPNSAHMTIMSLTRSAAGAPEPSAPDLRAAGNMLFLDFETTGLLADPNFAPLELSVIVTDSEYNVLHELGPLEITVEDAKLESMNDFVREMHAKTGLLERVKINGRPLAEVEQDVIAVVEEFFLTKGDKVDNASGVYRAGDKYRGAMAAGQSLGGFDRPIIEALMPRLHKIMDYRVLDVSSLRHVAQAHVPGFDLEAAVTIPYTHNSLDDVRYSVALAKACIEAFPQAALNR